MLRKNWKDKIQTKGDALQAIVDLEEYLDGIDLPENEFDARILITAAIKIAKVGIDKTP